DKGAGKDEEEEEEVKRRGTKEAKSGRADAAPGSSDRTSPGRRRARTRACQRGNRGAECALAEDPYGPSGDEGEGWESSTGADGCEKGIVGVGVGGVSLGRDFEAVDAPSPPANRREDAPDGDDDKCDICGDGGELICCGDCNTTYHSGCIGVNLDYLRDCLWHCPKCSDDGSDKVKAEASASSQKGDGDADNSPVKANGTSDTADYDFSSVDDSESNLSGVEPKVGMPVEILDDELVWNMAKIAHVSYGTDAEGTSPVGKRQAKPKYHARDDVPQRKCHVTVHYEGWPSFWDETLPYPHKRLARIFTYTKALKGFMVMPGSKQKKMSKAESMGSIKYVTNWTNIWPCKVSFRMPMPHPYQGKASDFLRREKKIFVKPYMDHLLPSATRQKLLPCGGLWSSKGQLRPWKDFNANEPVTSRAGDFHFLCEISLTSQPADSVRDMTYCVIGGFSQAFRAAQADWIKGCLPPNAILDGALLREEYCVRNIGGDAIDGVRYSGSLPTENGKGKGQRYEASASTTCAAIYEPEVKHAHFTTPKAPPVPPPSLPEPIPITDTAYPDRGVRRLPDSNRWAATLNMGSMDVFLGSYTSQSEAAHAVELALAKARRDDASSKSSNKVSYSPNGIGETSSTPYSNAGQMGDLMNTRIESIVSAFEEVQSRADEKQQPQHRFRLQEWMAQHYRHTQHLKDMPSGCEHAAVRDFSFVVNASNGGDGSRKRRRKSVPKRLHRWRAGQPNP
ncbi:hypothetical protein ACHAWF_015640, partial [Thalassiosira exigua]